MIAKEKQYGHLTLNLHQKLYACGVCLRVFVNGIDMTDGCVEANDIDGWARCHKRNDKGHFYVDDKNEVVDEILHGEVHFEQVEPWR